MKTKKKKKKGQPNTRDPDNYERASGLNFLWTDTDHTCLHVHGNPQTIENSPCLL